MARTSLLLLFAANILIPIAIFNFARGFFPYKPFLPGLAKYEVLDFDAIPAPPFNKVVFMVVDALRSDFVFAEPSGFTFTQSLIANGSAIPFTAHATSPTITMPRIKAMTTGSTPSFLDLILNFAESDTTSTLAMQDTWLAQLEEKHRGKMIMYGDDTWLKLFPGKFQRADGTSSFFVSVSGSPGHVYRKKLAEIYPLFALQDFTEVDNNVTRHVPDELQNADWNAMVLHYLGLDHIGHKAGPRSPNMVPKQREMDDIVKQIYQAMFTNPSLDSTLLILAGDHGMNDAGNHGGSAAGETSPALVFISHKFQSISSGLKTPLPRQEDFEYYKKVVQSDIVPTLAALLEFPIPRNNLGVLIPDMLDLWPSEDDKLQLVLRNARQILSVIKATYPSFEDDGPSTDCGKLSSDVSQLACEWRGITTRSTGTNAEDIANIPTDLQRWSRGAQSIMSGVASNYDIFLLYLGQGLAVAALALAIGALWKSNVKYTTPLVAFSSLTILYGVMTFASSYVEEEQHFWYWATAAWLSLLWVKGYRKRWFNPQYLTLTYIVLLVVARISRRWNQTGQKFAGSPDIARTFLTEHTNVLWSLVGATYLWNLNSLVTVAFARLGQLLAGTIGSALTTAALTFKLAFTDADSPELLPEFMRTLAGLELGGSLVTRARIVFVGIAAALVFTVAEGFRSTKRPNLTLRNLHELLSLFLITQSRATNIPLFLLYSVQLYLLSGLDLTTTEITTTSLLLQQASFFAFGNSNAISSIDLSSAYNGVSGYNVIAVGILTFASNWSGPIFWTSGTVLLLLQLRRTGAKDVLLQHLSLLTAFTAASLVAVMVACTFLRTHLFIWTVFSPKYLYTMAWSLGQHLLINVTLGSALYWLGTKYHDIEDLQPKVESTPKKKTEADGDSTKVI